MSTEVSSGGGVGRDGRWTPRVLALTASAALALSLGCAVALALYVWSAASIPRFGGGPAGAKTARGDAGSGIVGRCDERSCNYLLLGSDDRTGLPAAEREAFGSTRDIGGGERSDTIILVHTRPGVGRAVILSFPRDLWVSIPGAGWGKINSAFAGGPQNGGADRVARTVGRLTGMRINHVLYVNLAGFEGVVDAVGGIDMCFPTPLVDANAGLDLPAGCRHLTAAEALGVVRLRRHAPGECENPDFWRIGRQQQFLRALLAKVLSPGELVHLPDVVRAASRNVVADEGLDPTDLAYLAGQLSGIETGEADFRAVPGDWSSDLGAVRMDASAERLFRAIREDRPIGAIGEQLPGAAISPANVSTAVYDAASGDLAPEAVGVLAEGGFDVDPLARDAASLGRAAAERSAILFAPGARTRADVVSGYLPTLPLATAPRGALGGLDVAVLIGPDFEPAAPGSVAAAAGAPSDC
jgi:LCP family protein required for cell wall assembly